MKMSGLKWKMSKGELFKIKGNILESNNVAQDSPDVIEQINAKKKVFAKMKTTE